ncbi:MAG: hypothetical protein HC794_00175 [Nitrospiraceae bacterium]|nr:hypothetical protein [Nitrospiraceae bacterium]
MPFIDPPSLFRYCASPGALGSESGRLGARPDGSLGIHPTTYECEFFAAAVPQNYGRNLSFSDGLTLRFGSAPFGNGNHRPQKGTGLIA